MKNLFVIFAIYLVVVKCYIFPEVTTTEYYVPIINVRDIKESVVYFKENNTDDMLINSLILGLYSDHSLIVTSGEGYRMAEKRFDNKKTNCIIMTESLSKDELESASFKAIVKSHWSPLYLIITERSGKLTCQNGIISKTLIRSAQDYMNTIWHTHQVVRVVVSFPYTCPYHYIIYSGKEPSTNKKLYDRTIKIIHAKDKKELEAAILTNNKLHQLTDGFPLRANIFYRFPTSITQCNIGDYYMKLNLNYTNGFCGLDGLVMHDFIKHYQYNLTIPNDETCNKYGFVEPDNVVSGSLGCIVRGQLDISFNSRFVVRYTTDHYFHLHFITADSLAVIMQRPKVIPLWHYAYNNYSHKTGTILALLILVVGILTWASAWINKGITGQQPRKLLVYILDAITCTLFGFPIERRSERFRILKGTSLLCSIILLAYYQGNVNYQFTTCTRYKEIKTLKQLYSSKFVLYTSPAIRDLLMNSINTNEESEVAFLQRSQIKDESLIGIGYIFNHQDTATLVRKEDVLIAVLLNYTDKSGAPLMYVVDETVRVYYLSFIARPGFLFIDESHRFMMRMLEAGLPKKYYDWTRRTLKLGDTYPKTGPEPRPFAKIRLGNLRIAFIILAFGCLVSMCSFLVEIFRGKRLNKK